ncbi:glycosyltransferase family 2 protein [Mangrovibacterium marinum]|uniref:glycosyltransferase n=1 Tax=Mangrovibacterium marinum TaxID=1639118 RepID=UPI002A18CFFA|nr:glycosyltransferase family 2 protein [Mangrovibacterium marinum]
MIEISAIISTYNRAQYLDGLFASILQQTIDPACYEVVIVNNNCTDNTEQKCRQFMAENPGLRIVYCVEHQQGLSFGRNRGIRESSGRYVTFLDDDAVLTDDFFEQTIAFFKSHPQVSAIGGKILLKYLDRKPKWYNPYLASLLGYFNKGDREMPFSNDYFRGSNMSFHRSLFDKYEGFNTSLGRVGRQLYGNEEKELFYRLKEHGEEMWYVPSAVVLHLVPIERTYSEFIKRQALGTGKSQRQHAQVQGKTAILLSVVKELLKWGATLALALGYLLQAKARVAQMLILFRWWVSRGMLDC